MEDVAAGGQSPGLRVGERVVVRYRINEENDDAEGAARHRATMSDAVGDLVEVSPGAVVIMTKRGPVTVRREAVLLAKRVPPAPPKRRAQS